MKGYQAITAFYSPHRLHILGNAVRNGIAKLRSKGNNAAQFTLFTFLSVYSTHRHSPLQVYTVFYVNYQQ
jgi:hypothetical protein